MKELSKNLLLLLTVCLVFFILLEIGVRLFAPESKRKYQFDEILGAVGIPNIEFKTNTKEFGLITHHTNSLGFVDSEYKINKDKNTYRILFLGDSWTAALQVPRENNFCKLLEKNLNEYYSEKNIEVMNFGLDGIATGKEYLLLREIGLKYNPDLVILEINTGNDISFNALWLSSDPTEPYFDVENNSLKQIKYPEPFIRNKFISFINKQLLSTRFVYGKIRSLQNKIQSFKSHFEGDKVGEGVSFPGSFNVNRKEYDSDWKHAWEVSKALIKEIKNESQKGGADFLLVNLPCKFNVVPESWSDALGEYPSMKDTKWDLDKASNILKEFSQQEDVNYLDLLPIFREHVEQTGENLYEDHFNSNGHRLTAELLYKFLISSDFNL